MILKGGELCQQLGSFDVNLPIIIFFFAAVPFFTVTLLIDPILINNKIIFYFLGATTTSRAGNKVKNISHKEIGQVKR